MYTSLESLSLSSSCHYCHHASQYASWCTMIIISYVAMFTTCSWFMIMSHLALTVIQSHMANTKTEEPTFAKLQRWVSELQKAHFCTFLSNLFYTFHPNLAKNRLGSLQRRWPQELCNSGLMTLRPGRCKKSGAKWGLRDNPTSWTAHVLVESARHLECEIIRLHKIFLIHDDHDGQ